MQTSNGRLWLRRPQTSFMVAIPSDLAFAITLGLRNNLFQERGLDEKDFTVDMLGYTSDKTHTDIHVVVPASEGEFAYEWCETYLKRLERKLRPGIIFSKFTIQCPKQVAYQLMLDFVTVLTRWGTRPDQADLTFEPEKRYPTRNPNSLLTCLIPQMNETEMVNWLERYADEKNLRFHGFS